MVDSSKGRKDTKSEHLLALDHVDVRARDGRRGDDGVGDVAAGVLGGLVDDG